MKYKKLSKDNEFKITVESGPPNSATDQGPVGVHTDRRTPTSVDKPCLQWGFHPAGQMVPVRQSISHFDAQAVIDGDYT